MMKTIKTMIISLTTTALTPLAIAQPERGEDFTGGWGSFTSIDTVAASSETPRTPTLDADNRSFGTWGGFWPPAGTGGTAGLFLNNSTGFGADGGSIFNSPALVGDGFLSIPAYSGDEAGAYAYTGPFASLNLAGAARIEFDATNVQTLSPSASLEVRLMLRVPNSPMPPSIAWIISEPINLANVDVTPSFITNPASWKSNSASLGDTPAISVQPNTLSWQAFSVDDADLIPIAGGDEVAGIPVGPPIPGGVVESFILPDVTGFGIYLETNIVDDGGSPTGQGLWIDAIYLRDATVPVELSIFTAN